MAKKKKNRYESVAGHAVLENTNPTKFELELDRMLDGGFELVGFSTRSLPKGAVYTALLRKRWPHTGAYEYFPVPEK